MVGGVVGKASVAAPPPPPSENGGVRIGRIWNCAAAGRDNDGSIGGAADGGAEPLPSSKSALTPARWWRRRFEEYMAGGGEGEEGRKEKPP